MSNQKDVQNPYKGGDTTAPSITIGTNKQAPLHLVGKLSTDTQGLKANVTVAPEDTDGRGKPRLDAYGNVVQDYDAALASKTMDNNKGIGRVRIV